jgi:hypothetical protein
MTGRSPSLPRLVVTVLACLLVTSAGVCSQAEPPSLADPPSKEFEALLPLLSDPSREVRQAATDRIERLGPLVLPLLDEPNLTAGGEAVWRLRGIRRQLQHQAVEDAIEPTRVASSLGNLPIAEGLAAVFASRGGSIPVVASLQAADQGPEQPAEGGQGVDASTYWEVVRRILTRGGCRLGSDAAQPRKLLIRPQEPGEPAVRTDACGPLFVELLRLQPLPAEAPRALRGMLRVVWEPRLSPVLVRLPMASLMADGPGGEILPPAQRSSVNEGTVRPQASWIDLPLLLEAAPPSVESLAVLRGTLELWLLAAETEVVFRLDEVGRLPSVRRLGEASVTLEAATLDGEEIPHGPAGSRRLGRLTVRMSVAYPASEALQSHHTWITRPPIRCHAGDDVVASESDRVVRRDDHGLTREAVFRVPLAESISGEAEGMGMPPRGLRIAWRLPLAVRRTRIDFHLEDIPLPFPKKTGR